MMPLYKRFGLIMLYMYASIITQGLSEVITTSQTPTCPKDEFKTAFDCSNIYVMKEDALLSMAAANNSPIHDVISQNATPPGFIGYDIMACSEFNIQEKGCELSKMKLFATIDKQPFNFLPTKEDVTFPVCGSGYGRSGCGTFQTLTSSCGKIRYKTFKEDHPSPVVQDFFPQCKWTIISPANMRIKVIFQYLFIRYCSSECPCDSLVIYDVVNGVDTLNKRYCGRRLDLVLYSESNILNIILNRANARSMPGAFNHHLEFTYKTIPSNDINISSKPTIFKAENGSISLQNLTPAYSMNNVLFYQLQIRTEEHGVLALEWENRCNSSVHLMVYDGPIRSINPLRNISLKALEGQGFVDLSGFVSYVEFRVQSSCKTAEVLLHFSTKERKNLFGNYSKGQCRIINIGEMHLFKYILNPQRNPTDLLYKCLVLTAPRGKYISFSFAAFNFEGPNHDSCQSEGVAFWDGPNVVVGKKFGPYCGTEAHRLAFSQPGTITISSSNVLIIALYWYPNGKTENTKVELHATVTDCVGEFNWLSTFSESNAAISKKSVVDSRNIVNITLQHNRCIQLQQLPGYNHANVKYDVRIFPDLMGFNDHENEIWTNPFGTSIPGPCSKLAMDTGTFDKLTGIFVRLNLVNCSYVPVSYRIRIRNSVKQNCDIDEIHASTENSPGEKERVYLGTFCGTIHLGLNCLNIYHIVFRSPQIKNNGFNYVFELRTKDHKQISFLDSESIFLTIVESKNYKHNYHLPKLEISSLPFQWKTSWSFYVDFYFKTNAMQDCIGKIDVLVLEYELVKSEYPIPEIPSFNCKRGSHEYNNHCYEVFTSNSSTGVTWVESQGYCEALGGYLVSLNTKEELNFIQGLFVDHYHSNLQDDHRKYYIGMTSENMV